MGARSDGRGHLLIAGTGRAGTTLLVRILTRAGCDTGMSQKAIARAEASTAHAGLELPVTAETAPSLPTVVKSPHLVDVVADGIDAGWLAVDHMILPVRDLAAAAESRRAANRRGLAAGQRPGWVTGGLWKTLDAERQEEVLAVQFHVLVEALVAREVPITFLSFPRFARDQDYMVRHLGPYLAERFGVGEDALRAAHRSEVRLELVGDYD